MSSIGIGIERIKENKISGSDAAMWKSCREAYGAGLESQRARKGSAGSNPVSLRQNLSNKLNGRRFMTIILSVLIFSLLIFMHEAGHFIAARSVGIKVNEFALGMGPRLLHIKKGDTEYSLRAFPIGGFCSMEGEDEKSNSEFAFNNKPFWAKGLVVVAGPATNLLFAVILLILLVFATGVPSNSIDKVMADGTAIKAGLTQGDEIVQIDDTKTEKGADVISALDESTKDTVSVIVDRNGDLKNFTVDIETTGDGKRMIGIQLGIGRDFVGAVPTGIKHTVTLWNGTIDAFGQLFTGKISVKELSGPIGIVGMVGQTAEMGMDYVIVFAAFISMNLGIVNMLPIPALDGGRLLLLFLRVFFKENISDDLEGKIHFVGMIALFGLMIFITYQDIGRLIK